MKEKYFITTALLVVLLSACRKDDKSYNVKNNQSVIAVLKSDDKVSSQSLLAGPPPARTNAVPFLRYYNSGTNKHFYTSDPNELGAGKDGWVYQKLEGWLRRSPLTLNRFYNSSTGVHYYSTTMSPPPGFNFESAIGGVSRPPEIGLAVTEYQAPGRSDYLYLTNQDTDIIIPPGWINNGYVFNVYSDPNQIPAL